jgi:hypothetical protein
MLLRAAMRLLASGAAVAAAAPAVSNPWQHRAAAIDAHIRGAAPPVAGRPLAPFDRIGEARDGTDPLPLEVVTSPRPEDYLPDAALPLEWDWRSVAGLGERPVSFATRVRNQFLPLWCGSCWAHAATAVLGSRWLIHTNGTASGIDFSVQYFINCVNGSRGCHGGSSYEAFELAHSVGAVDSSCIPYVAYNQNCTAIHTCDQNLNGHHPKIIVAEPVRYFVGEFGVVGDGGGGPSSSSSEKEKETAGGGSVAVAASSSLKEVAMMKEIWARGPVASCMACPAEFEAYKGGIFATTDNRAYLTYAAAAAAAAAAASSSSHHHEQQHNSTRQQQQLYALC